MKTLVTLVIMLPLTATANSWLDNSTYLQQRDREYREQQEQRYMQQKQLDAMRYNANPYNQRIINPTPTCTTTVINGIYNTVCR